MKIVVARYNEDIKWVLPIIQYVIVYNKGNDDLDYIPKEKIIKCENVGREGETYIKHIIDNYDNLDDYTIFIQGKVFDHIFPESEGKSHRYLYNTLMEPKTYNFRYISRRQVDVVPSEFFHFGSGLPALPLQDVLPVSSDILIQFLNNQQEIDEKVINLITFLKNKSVISKHELCEYISRHGFPCEFKTQLYNFYSHDELFKKIYHDGNKYTYGSGALFICSKSNICKIPKDYWNEIRSTLMTIHPSSGYGLEKMWNFLLNDIYIK